MYDFILLSLWHIPKGLLQGIHEVFLTPAIINRPEEDSMAKENPVYGMCELKYLDVSLMYVSA